VLTTSYHAAVFALAQGIPTVCITDSLHYRTKMDGLVHQFGSACTVVATRDPRLRENVSEALSRAWESADDVRPGLLGAAADQVESGRAAYARLRHIVTERDARRPTACATGSRHLATGSGIEVGQRQQVLDDLTRQRDELHRICDQRSDVIQALKATCDRRLEEIEALAAELEQREQVIRSLVATCDLRLQQIEAITAEAARRESIIFEQTAALAELRGMLRERAELAQQLLADAGQRDGLIADLQAALAQASESLTPSPR
jgi:chromosome segregation ATPase